MGDNNDSAAEFHWADYLIFALTLAVSGAIGVYYAVLDRRERTSTTDVLLGGRNMGIVPVGLSLMASFLSAVSVLGVPADTFANDTMYVMIALSNFFTYPLAAHAFLPVFRGVSGLTSAYQYLERRFNRAVRVLGSLLFMVQMLLYMAVVLYAPALALSQVMNLSMLVSILVAGLVCTLYTAIGGLKAVIWTDTFQMFIVLGGLLAVIIKGTIEVGGVQAMFDLAQEHGKVRLDDFDPSPFKRYTFWGLTIGGVFTSMTIYGSNQAMIQRYLAMPTTRRAQISLYLNLPAALIFTVLLVYLGLVAFARYHDNNPLESCRILKSDQLIPLLVMDSLGNYHGLPGLFVACVFSASLSTVSSGVNALAAVFLTDIVKPAYKAFYLTNLSESRAALVSKVVAMLFGLATIGLAFLAGHLGSLIIQISLSIFGIFGGPLLGVFVLALFVPCANSWGALSGLACSVGVSFWLAIGSMLQQNRDAPPPRVCPTNQTALSYNITTMFTPSATVSSSSALLNFNITETVPLADVTKTGVERFYELSFMWYSMLAVFIVLIVGITVSLLTGGTRSKPVDARLLSPWYVRLTGYCHVQHDHPYDDSEDSDHTEDMHKNGMTVLKQIDAEGPGNNKLDLAAEAVHNDRSHWEQL